MARPAARFPSGVATPVSDAFRESPQNLSRSRNRNRSLSPPPSSLPLRSPSSGFRPQVSAPPPSGLRSQVSGFTFQVSVLRPSAVRPSAVRPPTLRPPTLRRPSSSSIQRTPHPQPRLLHHMRIDLRRLPRKRLRPRGFQITAHAAVSCGSKRPRGEAYTRPLRGRAPQRMIGKKMPALLL
jgi:hypothetical protein